MAGSPDNSIMLPIDFSDPFSSKNLYFFGCLAVALFVVVLFGRGKFAESTVEPNKDDPISQLLPRYLATPEEYFRAQAFYLAAMSLFVAAVSLLGPRVVGFSEPVPEVAGALPLYVALVLVGFMPNVKWLRETECLLRRFAHERAFIPGAARATGDTLAAAEFNFAKYNCPPVLNSPRMRGVKSSDFVQPRDTIEYNWARLSCLLWELQSRLDTDQAQMLDGELLDRYASDLEAIALRRKSLEEEIAQYRNEKADNTYYTNDPLHRSIRKTLRQLYVLLGCAVRLRLSPNGDMNAVLKKFGFVLDSSSSEAGNQNLIIVAVTMVAGCVCGLVVAAVAAHTIFGLWKPSNYFPNKAFDVFQLTLNAVLWSGVALLIAERVRARLLRKNRWFATKGIERRRIGANYVRVAVACAVPGYLVLLLVGQGVFIPTVDFAVGLAPFALLPAWTGGFYAYHLDNVELGWRPGRMWEVGTQALATGCFWLAAGSAWVDGNFREAADFLLLHFGFGLVVGAALGYYVPDAAENNRVDPLLAARCARIAALKKAALDQLGSEETADHWLQQPSSDLNGQTPIDAAANIETFEKSMSLLRTKDAGASRHKRAGRHIANDAAASENTLRHEEEPQTPASRRSSRGRLARQQRSASRRLNGAEAPTTVPDVPMSDHAVPPPAQDAQRVPLAAIERQE